MIRHWYFFFSFLNIVSVVKSILYCSILHWPRELKQLTHMYCWRWEGGGGLMARNLSRERRMSNYLFRNKSWPQQDWSEIISREERRSSRNSFNLYLNLRSKNNFDNSLSMLYSHSTVQYSNCYCRSVFFRVPTTTALFAEFKVKFAFPFLCVSVGKVDLFVAQL